LPFFKKPIDVIINKKGMSEIGAESSVVGNLQDS
jgi:hypothetical protein